MVYTRQPLVSLLVYRVHSRTVSSWRKECLPQRNSSSPAIIFAPSVVHGSKFFFIHCILNLVSSHFILLRTNRDSMDSNVTLLPLLRFVFQTLILIFKIYESLLTNIFLKTDGWVPPQRKQTRTYPLTNNSLSLVVFHVRNELLIYRSSMQKKGMS